MLYSPFSGSSYEELIAHYPRFYREIYEMKAILEAFGTIFDALQDNIEVVMSDAFIEYADEATVTRLEQFFELTSDETKTLEERRRQIKFCYSGFGNVSASFLKEMLSAITDADLDITFEPFDAAGNNRLNLYATPGGSKTVNLQEIVNTLNRWIPAHLKYCISVRLRIELQTVFSLARMQKISYTRKMAAESPDMIADILVDENGVMLGDEDGNLLIL